MEVKLYACNDLTCIRNDHYICPNTVCHQMLHPVIFIGNIIQNQYDVKIVRCMDMACFNDHIRCPYCLKDLHVKK